ncbi:hypothetical protein HAT2_00219 [Candidatus Similichlamydia laticola]|uniref:Uncharacterized protein n=1 Tax=Candidatus Similichlamydia laticola TaxID=2170265 RepID=A0A369KE27_9BACT|nr:hypothetical protein HAT2_00219 [Candidatus Similichlamydia laticola]
MPRSSSAEDPVLIQFPRHPDNTVPHLELSLTTIRFDIFQHYFSLSRRS